MYCKVVQQWSYSSMFYSCYNFAFVTVTESFKKNLLTY
jgi:hypothetical protein